MGITDDAIECSMKFVNSFACSLRKQWGPGLTMLGCGFAHLHWFCTEAEKDVNAICK